MPTSFASPISSSSPVIDTVLERQRQISIAKEKWKWGTANFFIALLLFLEAHASSFHMIVSEDSSWRPWMSYFGTFLALIFFTNALFDLYGHLFPLGISSGSLNELPFSPMQLKLLGVKANDYGFKVATPTKQSGKSNHPYGFGTPLNGSFISPQSTMYTSMDSSSWIYNPGGSQTMSPTSLEKSKEVKQTTSPSMNGTFTDEKSLMDYLNDYEQKERAKAISHNNQTSPNSPGSWTNGGNGTSGGGNSTNVNRQDHTSILRNVAYQLSTPMPCSSDTSGLDVMGGPGHSGTRADTKSESLCRKLGIDPLDLVFWMQNIRIWISQTILQRIVKEIECVNKKLMSCGLGDCLVGMVGVERLRKCASLPQLRDSLTEVNNLLTFLSVTPNQEYLVERLKELSSGGALSQFKWNGGGQKWSDKLPTDAELIMGFFAAYMDVSLPANFRNSFGSSGGHSHQVDDKPFTGVYYSIVEKKSTETSSNNLAMLPALTSQQSRPRHSSSGKNLASSARQSSSIVILQSSERPPHFYLQIDGKEKLEISSGRNNLFHTLLFFLHHIKTRESGMLGRLNLGASGVNVLWVIEGCNTK